MDAALLNGVKEHTYDFDRVCSDLKRRFPHKSWMLSVGSCRERFARLQDMKDQKVVKDLWTEALDDELRSLVRSHTFDFSKVADDLQAHCKSDLTMVTHSSLFTADACRERYAELDRAEPAPATLINIDRSPSTKRTQADGAAAIGGGGNEANLEEGGGGVVQDTFSERPGMMLLISLGG